MSKSLKKPGVDKWEIQGVAIEMYRKYEHIVTSILRDPKTSDMTRIWMIQDLKDAYAYLSSVVFCEDRETYRNFGNLKGQQEAYEIRKTFSFSYEAEMEGYEEGVRKWISSKIISKKHGEEMIKRHREEALAKKPERDAHDFLSALILFGADRVENIYILAGEDFNAAVENLYKIKPDEAEKYVSRRRTR